MVCKAGALSNGSFLIAREIKLNLGDPYWQQARMFTPKRGGRVLKMAAATSKDSYIVC